MIEIQPEVIGSYQGKPQPAPVPPPMPEPEPEPPTPEETMQGLEKDYNEASKKMNTAADEMKKIITDKLEQGFKEKMDKTKTDHDATLEKITKKMETKHQSEIAKKDKQLKSLKDAHATKVKELKALQGKVKEALFNE